MLHFNLLLGIQYKSFKTLWCISAGWLLKWDLCLKTKWKWIQLQEPWVWIHWMKLDFKEKPIWKNSKSILYCIHLAFPQLPVLLSYRGGGGHCCENICLRTVHKILHVWIRFARSYFCYDSLRISLKVCWQHGYKWKDEDKTWMFLKRVHWFLRCAMIFLKFTLMWREII